MKRILFTIMKRKKEKKKKKKLKALLQEGVHLPGPESGTLV